MEKLLRGQQVVVTGASGFIGSHVARQLVEYGAKVRGLSRKQIKAVPGDPIEWFQTDITRPETLHEPFRDCRYVFHVAGDYRFWARDPRKIFRNNVDGTNNVLAAATAVGAEKIIVTSTQGVLEPGTLENPGDETRLVQPSGLHGPYKTSKFAAREMVSQHLAKGNPIISVLPGAPIGENDLRPTPTGAVIVNFLNGRLPLLARTGLSFVDVADVARGHLLALQKGKIGESYLLAGHNLWLKEFLELLTPWSRHPVPQKYAPWWLSQLAACVTESWHHLTRSDSEPFITRESVSMSRRPYFFSSDKAIRELGYVISPLENALERAVLDFSTRGLIPQCG